MNKQIHQYIAKYEETNLSSYSEDDSDTDLIKKLKTLRVNSSTLSPISNNFFNTETFITSFDLVDNAVMMITNLANCSLRHCLTNNLHINMNDQTSNDLQISDDFQTDLKMIISFNLVQNDLNVFMFFHIFKRNIIMKNTDLVTYIIIDCYTFNVFYDIMIDLDVSKQLTTDYVQFLAYQKNNKNDVIDTTKTDAVNVQFEIE
jgi:hypothetical protein